MSSRRFSLQISPLPFSRKKHKVVGTEKIENENTSGRRFTETDVSLKNRLMNRLINKHRSQNETFSKGIHEEQVKINEKFDFDENEQEESIASSDSCSEKNNVEFDEQKRRLLRKMDVIKEKLKSIHKSQGSNVEHFLSVTEKMPKTEAESNPQLFRIRQNFEKKNRQSAQIVNALQKKMESYQQRLKNIESPQQQSLRPRTSTMPNNHLYVSNNNEYSDISKQHSSAVNLNYLSAVPKSFVSKFWKKSESTGNLNAASKNDDVYLNNNYKKSKPSGKTAFYLPTTFDRSLSDNVTKLKNNNFYHDIDETDKFVRKDNGQFLHNLNYNFTRLFEELSTIRSDLEKTQSTMNDLTIQMQEQYNYFNQALNEEKLHLDRLENQSYGQSELYTAEITNLRQEIQNVDDRLSYQINASMRDLNDETEHLQLEVESLNLKMISVQRYVGMEVSESFSSFSQKFRRSSIIVVQLLTDVLLWTITLLNGYKLKKVIIGSVILFVFYYLTKMALSCELVFND